MEENETSIEIIKTNLRRYTFENKKIKSWVENNSIGNVLNLFSGKTKLNIEETRVDIDKDAIADHYIDALEYVKSCQKKYNTIIIDPPYSYRKSIEMYKGNYTSKFKLIADNIDNILRDNGRVISFGYHSTFMGKKRGYYLNHVCLFAHGGAQHCTIAIIEVKANIKGE